MYKPDKSILRICDMSFKQTTIPVWAMALALCLASCVSTKKIVYFQSADSLYQTVQPIAQAYAMKVKPADNLLIKVTCDNPELLTVFNQDVMMGVGGNSSNVSAGAGAAPNNAYGYTVNDAGNVVLPMLGAVHVAGMTTEQAAESIERQIREKELIADPDVTVRLLNARVAVVGAVRRPGPVTLSSERNSIIDVLASAGDVDDNGLKQNIRLFREENGERKMYTIDLTRADIVHHPAFYVQQNDMIYVEPNKSKSIQSSPFYTYLSAGGSVLGVISAVVSIVVLLTK